MKRHLGLQDIPNPSVWLPNNHLELDGTISGWWYSYTTRAWLLPIPRMIPTIIQSEMINTS